MQLMPRRPRSAASASPIGPPPTMRTEVLSWLSLSEATFSFILGVPDSRSRMRFTHPAFLRRIKSWAESASKRTVQPARLFHQLPNPVIEPNEMHRSMIDPVMVGRCHGVDSVGSYEFLGL